MPSILLAHGRSLELTPSPLVMGILNVTPDSFSDGGVHFDAAVAVEAALKMEQDGAAMIDVGGESTRPGSSGVSAEEELARVLPVIRDLRLKSSVPISIDTSKPEVAEASLDAGADLVNDVTACRSGGMYEVIRRHRAAVILMHMRGEPRTMQQEIHFDDLIGEISSELREAKQRALDAGIEEEAILVDPGIGFGKAAEHNLEILRRARELRPLGPVVIGASRKAFIGHLTGQPGGKGRAAGSLGAVAAAALAGAAIVRVHDVRETVDFLKIFTATGVVA